jgi:hypothetical protein
VPDKVKRQLDSARHGGTHPAPATMMPADGCSAQTATTVRRPGIPDSPGAATVTASARTPGSRRW